MGTPKAFSRLSAWQIDVLHSHSTTAEATCYVDQKNSERDCERKSSSSLAPERKHVRVFSLEVVSTTMLKQSVNAEGAGRKATVGDDMSKKLPGSFEIGSMFQ